MSGGKNELKKYRFPEILTNQNRWFGLLLDELILAAIYIGWGITTPKHLFGIDTAVLVHFGTRKLKEGQDSSWLCGLIYRYMPTALLRGISYNVLGSCFRQRIRQNQYQGCYMEHGARLSTSRVMAAIFIFMSVLVVFSLSFNVIQGTSSYRLQSEQHTVVTPMTPNTPFAVSQNSADASYLQQIVLSSIASHLNVSSEIVDTSHQALL